MTQLPSTIKGLILDMDGVLWTENQPIGDLKTVFSLIKSRGLKVCLATNNATRTPDQYINRLRDFGVDGLEQWQVITSAHALTNQLSKRVSRGGEIFVIGENGLRQALVEGGFRIYDDEDWHPGLMISAVAVGMDRGISFSKLKRATLLIRQGSPFYGTNPDRTFPTPEGLIPGAGAIIAALAAATDVDPIIVGKPAPFMIDLAREMLALACDQVLVVGDRLETDIAGGQAAGCPVALVLSGVTTREAAASWTPKPDFIFPNLTAMLA